MRQAALSATLESRRPRIALALLPVLFLSFVLVVGPTLASATPVVEQPTATTDPIDTASGTHAGDAAKTELAEKWGIEITSIHLTANDHMIDYRYRVLDAGKATDLFKRQIKPHLIHQDTEMVLAVPDTAKLGPLRNSNMPKEGKIYWMFFGNAGKLVKPGDKVTVVIGDFRAEDLIVK
jgi:hypothetical protein